MARRRRRTTEADASASDGRSKSSSASIRHQPADSASTFGRRGETAGKKQMSYVGAIYSLAPVPSHGRRRGGRGASPEACADRPKPQHKHVWAQMTQICEGEVVRRTELFLEMAVECYERDPQASEALDLCHGWGTAVVELAGGVVSSGRRHSGLVPRHEASVGGGGLLPRRKRVPKRPSS